MESSSSMKNGGPVTPTNPGTSPNPPRRIGGLKAPPRLGAITETSILYTTPAN